MNLPSRTSQKANDNIFSDLLAQLRHSPGDNYDSYFILATSTTELARIEPPPGGRSMASAASVAPTSSHAS